MRLIKIIPLTLIAAVVLALLGVSLGVVVQYYMGVEFPFEVVIGLNIALGAVIACELLGFIIQLLLLRSERQPKVQTAKTRPSGSSTRRRPKARKGNK